MNKLYLELFFLFLGWLVLYTYIIYPVILLVFKQKKNNYQFIPNYLPTVSIIVSANNEEKVIKEKISNCCNLDYPEDKLEILIGSDGSSDNTVGVINKFKQNNIKLYDFKQRRGKLLVLKDLISKASGEIIVFSDANTIYEVDALKKMTRYFSDKKIGCVCGRLKLKGPNGSVEGEYEGLYWRYESFIKQLEGALGSCLGANGAIYAIRKELFPDIPSNTIVEDFVIPMKILEKGYKVMYEKEAVAYEESSFTIQDESKRKIRIGAGAYQALFLMLPMLNIFKGLSSFVYWSHKVIRWFVPFLMIAVLILNFFLLNTRIYTIMLYLQLSVYCGATIGYLLSKYKINNKLFAVMYYFVSMNLSLLFGFFRFILGTQKVTWERVDR